MQIALCGLGEKEELDNRLHPAAETFITLEEHVLNPAISAASQKAMGLDFWAPLPLADKEKIAHGNAERLLRL